MSREMTRLHHSFDSRQMTASKQQARNKEATRKRVDARHICGCWCLDFKHLISKTWWHCSQTNDSNDALAMTHWQWRICNDAFAMTHLQWRICNDALAMTHLQWRICNDAFAMTHLNIITLNLEYWSTPPFSFMHHTTHNFKHTQIKYLHIITGLFCKRAL